MEQTMTVFETDYEAIVIGGNFAGLSAAMQLARARRRILVLDAGKPRNRFAPASHGFLGQDGRSPKEIMETGRQQLLAYPTVHFQQSEATDAVQEDEAFSVTFGDGSQARAKRLILATGMVDHLPDVPGMQELWGVGVNQCPYCHGYEVSDRRLAVFGTSAESVQQAVLLRDWSDDVTLLTNGEDRLTPDDRDRLAVRDIHIDEAALVRLIPDGKELEAVEFRDGRRVPYGAMFLGTRCSFASPLAERLGCGTEEGSQGPRVKTDQFHETTVPGVFAAGDAASPLYNATLASASGVIAGIFAHKSLLPK